MNKDDVMNSSIEVVSLDYKNQEQVDAAAKLHQELLSDSPISQLGYQFMTRFYYTKLIKAGLVNCDLCKHEGKYVAFLAYTKYPFTFMEEGRRRYFLYLSFLLLESLLLNPYRIKTILKVIQIGRKRQFKKNGNKTGEMLSFGVLEPYGNVRDETTGLRISNLLFERALAYFKKEGFVRIRGEIKKDNKPSLLFWSLYGGVIKDHRWSKQSYYLVSIEL